MLTTTAAYTIWTDGGSKDQSYTGKLYLLDADGIGASYFGVGGKKNANNYYQIALHFVLPQFR